MNLEPNGYIPKGTPDILFIYRGISYFIELKLEYNKPSALQKVIIKELNKVGANAFVFKNHNGWEKTLDSIIQGGINA